MTFEMQTKVFLLLSLYICSIYANQYYKRKDYKQSEIYVPNPLIGKKANIGAYEKVKEYKYNNGYEENEQESGMMEAYENTSEDRMGNYEPQEPQYAYAVKDKSNIYNDRKYANQMNQYSKNEYKKEEQMSGYKPNYNVRPMDNYRIPYYKPTTTSTTMPKTTTQQKKYMNGYENYPQQAYKTTAKPSKYDYEKNYGDMNTGNYQQQPNEYASPMGNRYVQKPYEYQNEKQYGNQEYPGSGYQEYSGHNQNYGYKQSEPIEHYQYTSPCVDNKKRYEYQYGQQEYVDPAVLCKYLAYLYGTQGAYGQVSNYANQQGNQYGYDSYSPYNYGSYNYTMPVYYNTTTTSPYTTTTAPATTTTTRVTTTTTTRRGVFVDFDETEEIIDEEDTREALALKLAKARRRTKTEKNPKLKYVFMKKTVAIPTVTDDSNEEDKTEFEVFGIIPQFIDTMPEQTLQVFFDDSGVGSKVGDVLTSEQVQTEPAVIWTPERNAYYTLMLTDIDSPSGSDSKKREFLYWLMVNIPGNDIERGDVKAPYIRPSKGSDVKRYLIQVFKQNKRRSFIELPIYSKFSTAGRLNFNSKRFAKNLLLGPLVGAFFYHV